MNGAPVLRIQPHVSCTAVALAAPSGAPFSVQPPKRPPQLHAIVGGGEATSPSRRALSGARLTVAVPRQEPDEWVQRAQRGDTEAFAELFRRHRDAVARLAYRMMGRDADIEDVVQEVFLQVFRSLPDFRGQAKFSTWLHRVTVNVVLMIRRRAKSRPVLTPDETGRHEPEESRLPDQEVVRAQRIAAFRRLLDRLSEKKRTVFVLHELEGMAPARIAEVVDCPVLTVRTRLFYARRELAQLMRSEPCLAQLADELPARASRSEVAARKQGAPTPPKPTADESPSEDT